MLNSSTEVLLGKSASFKAVGGGAISPNHRLAKNHVRVREAQEICALRKRDIVEKIEVRQALRMFELATGLPVTKSPRLRGLF